MKGSEWMVAMFGLWLLMIVGVLMGFMIGTDKGAINTKDEIIKRIQERGTFFDDKSGFIYHCTETDYAPLTK